MTNKSVDLFTKEEHVIIADWLGVEPKCDACATMKFYRPGLIRSISISCAYISPTPRLARENSPLLRS